MDTKEIQNDECKTNQPIESIVESTADEQDLPPNEELAQFTEAAKSDTTHADQPAPELEPIDPIADSTAPETRPASIARTVIGAICSALPIIVGIIAAIAALNCEVNAKYLGESAATALTMTIVVAIVTPFVCAFLFPNKNDKDSVERKGMNTLLPLAASFYLAFHTLTNDLGIWGDAILLLSIVAVVFFAIKMFSNNIVWKILSAFGVFALGAAIIALLYLDFNIELNSPFKLAVQFGAVALILGTIADARSMLSRIKAGWFIFFKSIASSLCLICCGLIFTAFARGFKIFPDVYFVLSILYACYAINSIAEIASLFILKRNSDFNVNT